MNDARGLYKSTPIYYLILWCRESRKRVLSFKSNPKWSNTN